MRVENIFIQNHSNSLKNIEDEKLINHIDSNKEDYSHYENHDLYLIHTLNTNSNYEHILKENIMFSNTYDYNSMNEEDQKKPDLLISPLNPLSPHEITRLSNTKNLQDEREIKKKEEDQILIEKDELKEIIYPNNEIQKRACDESLIYFIEKLENAVNKNYEMNKNHFFSLFIEKLFIKIEILNDHFIEDVTDLEKKINFYKLRSIFIKFHSEVKKKIISTKYCSYNKGQCEKFLRYRNYKMKNKTFENLKEFSHKRANWLKFVRRELKQPTIW